METTEQQTPKQKVDVHMNSEFNPQVSWFLKATENVPDRDAPAVVLECAAIHQRKGADGSRACCEVLSQPWDVESGKLEEPMVNTSVRTSLTDVLQKFAQIVECWAIFQIHQDCDLPGR